MLKTTHESTEELADGERRFQRLLRKRLEAAADAVTNLALLSAWNGDTTGFAQALSPDAEDVVQDMITALQNVLARNKGEPTQ